MKKIVIVPVIALLLSGCNSKDPNLIVRQFTVVQPDPAMYNCPTVDQFPPVKTLTDLQVGQLLFKLYKNNITCKKSLDAIQAYLEQAQRTLSK